ncbi:MAG: hypothetical protein OEY97_10910 [Nitrospirota bacterium]|nr:hypothetical protein [Nitrospirota bacterium]
MTETHEMSRIAKIALVMNVFGTMLLGVSMFINHPLIFMLVIMMGVGLLGSAFLIWAYMAARTGLGIHPTRQGPG